MKQFLIVLLVTAAVFVGWRVYSGSSDDRASRPDGRELTSAKPPKDQRPKTGPATREKGLAGKKADLLYDSAPTSDQQGLAEMLVDDGSWTQYVQDDDVVKLEDAWEFDLSAVDYEAPILAAFESPSDRRVEVTQNDWRRYLCLTLAAPLVRSELLAKHGRAVAEAFGEVFGFTDEAWNLVVEGLANSKGQTVEEYRIKCAREYDLSEGAALLVKRHSIEGLIAHLPRVNDANELPQLARQVIEDPQDRVVLMTVAAGIREGRVSMQDPGELSALVGMIDTAFVMFTRSMPDHEFRTTWSFFDGEMPPNAVAACTLGETEASGLQPPWLHPGEIAYVTVDEVWPHVPSITNDRKEGLLRELVWYLVLQSELDHLGHRNTPEDTWLTYADEHVRRQGSLMNLSAHSSVVARFPTPYHYRAFTGVYWSFKDDQADGWDAEDNLRAFYDRNRVFIESWTPAVEAIMFPAMVFEDGVEIDWEGARRKAEEARARVLAGEEDFTEMRNRLHTELRERLLKAELHDIAESFDEAFQNGMLAGRMPLVERSFSESAFGLMVDTTSVTRNAVARLDPGEISPVWRIPNGYAILRVHGVAAADLEGSFDDYKVDTKNEYSRAQFRMWANDVLKNSKFLD